MQPFDYAEPASVAEAASALCAREAARIIAGGTDVLVQLKEGRMAAGLLVSLTRVPGLRGIDCTGTAVSIGAMTTIAEIESSGNLREWLPIVLDAVDRFGSVQTRNQATLGGNVCNASPGADSVPALLALDAEVTYWSAGETKREQLRRFFVGPGKTILGPHDILTAVRFEKPPARSVGVYVKFSARNGMDLPLVSVAVQLQMDQSLSRCEKAAIALGAVAPTPIRAPDAEEILTGERLTPEVLARAADRASQEARPRNDFRSSAEYRKSMIRALLPEAVERARARLRRFEGRGS